VIIRTYSSDQEQMKKGYRETLEIHKGLHFTSKVARHFLTSYLISTRMDQTK